MMTELPLPPLRLATRVGPLDPGDPWGEYEYVGRAMRDRVVEGLPRGWGWEGRQALDFGCGAGRVLRQFEREARLAEIWGCDIDEPSIAWIARHLAPPFHAFVVAKQPPMAKPDGCFDLIWASSVFTHLVRDWSAWLVELHRVLADDGILMASFLGRGAWESSEREPWDEDEVGMCVLRAGQPWEMYGPTVFHSEWWLRAHWGRAFEFLSLDRGEQRDSHGWVVLRKRAGAVSAAEIERPDAYEARELGAALRNNELLHAEDARIRSAYLRATRLRRAIRARTRARSALARLRGHRR